ncbi:MAG: hypothetical protein ABI465_11220 [Ktedonobacteraceae bacterium]
MSNNMEDWKVQQEAKHAAAHKEGSLTFLGGGAAARRRDREERPVSYEFPLEARKRKELFETTLKALHEACFPDEVAYFRDMLLKLSLTEAEHQEMQKVI